MHFRGTFPENLINEEFDYVLFFLFRKKIKVFKILHSETIFTLLPLSKVLHFSRPSDRVQEKKKENCVGFRRQIVR